MWYHHYLHNDIHHLPSYTEYRSLPAIAVSVLSVAIGVFIAYVVSAEITAVYFYYHHQYQATSVLDPFSQHITCCISYIKYSV